MSEQKPATNGKPASKRRRPKVVEKNGEAFKKLRVMVLCHEDLVPPDSIDDLTPKEVAPFKTEWDVISTLKKIGHEVLPVGVYNNLGIIGNALLEFKPRSLLTCWKNSMGTRFTISMSSAISN
jgi:hypothetical protein